jgi:hypothetical protein
VREVWINLHYAADAIRQSIGDGARDFGLRYYVRGARKRTKTPTTSLSRR